MKAAAVRGPVLVVGAASDIGRAIAYLYAETRRPLILAARNADRLATDAEDLHLRFNVRVRVAELDVLDTAGHASFINTLTESELPEIVVMVVGLLGDQAASEHDNAAAELVMRTNYIGPCLFLSDIANRMSARGSGTIVGISSVAGDRGRASNYVYGSAKAGFTAFLSGLRNRLANKNVSVITVKPGFVNTRMTASLKLPKRLTAEPEEVARHVFRAEQRGRDVIYVRPIWRIIMWCIRVLPECAFKYTKL
jgi:decaprenylphospho-beta-D-erythro-pentofuranosid-2-ulose 2-reductase